MIDKNKLQELVETAPVVLLALKDKKIIDEINNMLPYSTGFEIECGVNHTEFNKDNFDVIPDIMEVDTRISSGEQRFRIPNGFKGIICLYNLCEQLKNNLLLNYGSGIHYHVDCTGCFNQDLVGITMLNQSWILEELSSWDYKGTYNSKGINCSNVTGCDFNLNTGNWLRFNHLRTMEFRIGEMSFDYKVLIRRILHCNSIVKRVKDKLIEVEQPVFEEIDRNKIIKYLKVVGVNVNGLAVKIAKLEAELEKLVPIELVKTEEEIISDVVKGRVHKINI